MSEIGRIRVVGKAVPIKVFNLLAKKGELSAEWNKALSFYERGLEHFKERRFSEAADSFKEALWVFPDDGPASTYLRFSQDYAAAQPSADWDGVFNLSAK
ncbi:MAG: tetratricopeptide repeat protein [Elusimicrobia bacterium]|nr:tetratricopeptide repeat protein [Elusimicrobiota bacterium]